MAGKIIADTIEASGSQISLNVGNVTILSASSTGLTLTPTSNVNINVANSNVTFTTANITGVSTFAAGSITAPSITTSGDTNTGIFFPAADTIAFAEGGAEAMRIDSSGNVGIGTSSPTARLTVVTGSPGNNEGEIRISENATYYAGLRRVNATDEFRIGSYGASQNITFYTVSSERARITSAGDFLVGTTSTSTPTSSTADVYLGGIAMTPSRRTTASAANVNIDPTSGLFARSTSSLKYKRDVENATHGLAEVMALRPVTYKGKSEADGDKVFGGLIAEEVHEAGLTEFVQYAGDGSPDSLAYGNMVALAFKAIQEQQALIESLTARIAALEGAQA